MKTVQEHLRELDKERLIEDYHYRIRKQIVEAYLNVDNSELADLTLKDIYDRTEKNISNYIDRLRNLETAALKDGSTGLLYLYDRLTDALNYENEPCCEFTTVEEVLERGDAAENYSYKLCSQNEIMGFLVADDKYTRNHIEELAIAVMYDASWYGYADEDKAAMIESIENPIVDDDEAIEFDDVDEPDDVDGEYKEVLRQTNNLVDRYNRQSNKTQLRLIQRNLLHDAERSA